MSGGAYKYSYGKVVAFADALDAGIDFDNRPKPYEEGCIDALHLRKKFAAHLRLVAEAMRAIEWTDSGDSGLGDERKAIADCLEGIEDKK